MLARDLQQEAIDKISFPEEDEYEDDVDRIFVATNILKEYFVKQTDELTTVTSLAGRFLFRLIKYQ